MIKETRTMLLVEGDATTVFADMKGESETIVF